MGWSLWIDDQLRDMDAPERWTPVADGWYGAPDVEVAQWLVEKHGMPDEIDFDHDLGLDEDGQPLDVRPFIAWLLERSYDAEDNLPPPPKWKVHSANPVGRDWINATMQSWADHAVSKG